jgi:hypothetical protein
LKQGADGMPVADIGRARLTGSRSKHIHATYRRGVFCNTEINGQSARSTIKRRILRGTHAPAEVLCHRLQL